MTAKRKAAPSESGNPVMSLMLNKDSQFLTQEQRIYLSFMECPKTMLQVSIETGIRPANICRCVGKLRKIDKIAVVRYGLCPISDYRAGFYTTNPDLFPLEPIKTTSQRKEVSNE